jgi:hypothetical protein
MIPWVPGRHPCHRIGPLPIRKLLPEPLVGTRAAPAPSPARWWRSRRSPRPEPPAASAAAPRRRSCHRRARGDGGADGRPVPVTDRAFHVRVVDRPAPHRRPAGDLIDVLGQRLHGADERLVFVREFDHDAGHGVSSVESSGQTPDGTALPHLSSSCALTPRRRPRRSRTRRGAQDEIHTSGIRRACDRRPARMNDSTSTEGVCARARYWVRFSEH